MREAICVLLQNKGILFAYQSGEHFPTVTQNGDTKAQYRPYVQDDAQRLRAEKAIKEGLFFGKKNLSEVR